jgi:hypothetical protein
MERIPPAVALAPLDSDFGCAYISGESANQRRCGAPRRPGSAYCDRHHALCHLGCGTAAEKDALREVEALARMVGGRRGTRAGHPPPRFLRRLEQTVGIFARQKCS